MSNESWVVDLLHAWALGVLAYLVGFIFRFLINSKLYHPLLGFLDNADADKLALMHLRSLLLKHYSDHKDVGTKANSN